MRCIASAGIRLPRATAHISDDSWANRNGAQIRIGYGGEQFRLDPAFARLTCEVKATLGLFDVLDDFPPRPGASRGL